MARARRRLNRPTEATFVVALLVALIGVLAYLNILHVPELRAMAFWLVVFAFVILALGDRLRGF